MSEHADKTSSQQARTTSQPAAHLSSGEEVEGIQVLTDQRAAASVQRRQHQIANQSPQVQHLRDLQARANRRPSAGDAAAPVQRQSAPVLQRKQTVTVKGSTHTVAPKGDSIFEGTNVQLLHNGSQLVIADQPDFVSRRGPNQEVAEHRDLDRAASFTYPYYRVLSIDGQAPGQEVYVRGDTVQTQSGKAVAEPAADHRDRASDKQAGVGDLLKGVGKGVGMGLLNAVLPVVSVKDWVGSLKQIHQDRKDGTAPLGKNGWWSVLSGTIETTQLVAAVATAVSIVAALIGLIPGAQVAAVAATVAGVIATIAHAVTAGLRLVAMVRLAYRWKNASSTLRQAQAAKEFWGQLGGFAGNAIGVLGGGLLGGFDVSSIGSAASTAAQGGAEASKQAASTATSAGIGQLYNTDADAAGALASFWQSQVKPKVDLSRGNLLRYRQAKDKPADLSQALDGANQLAQKTDEMKGKQQALPESADSADKGQIKPKDADTYGQAEAKSEKDLQVTVSEDEMQETGPSVQGKFAPVMQRGVVGWIKRQIGRLGSVKKAARKLYRKIRAKLMGKMAQLLGIEEPVAQAQADLQDHVQVDTAIEGEQQAADQAMGPINELEEKLKQR